MVRVKVRCLSMLVNAHSLNEGGQLTESPVTREPITCLLELPSTFMARKLTGARCSTAPHVVSYVLSLEN